MGIFFVCASMLHAQRTFPAGTPCVKKYNIKVQTTSEYPKLYIQGFYGSDYYLVDSAVVKNGTAVFKKSKCELPCGVYLLAYFDSSHTYTNIIGEFIINQNAKLLIHHTQHTDSASGYVVNDLDIAGSPDNDILYSFRNRLMTVYTPNVREVCEEYLKTAPESFAAKYIMAAYGTYQMAYETPEKNFLKRRQMMDDFDYSEPRLLHTPVLTTNIIRQWVMREYDTDTIIAVTVRAAGQTVNTYWGDGLIISTPTGSTAYSMSCGGPILHPHSQVMVLTPIASHSLNVRPLVIPADTSLEIEVQSRSGHYSLNLDSQKFIVEENILLTVTKENFCIRTLSFEHTDFYEVIREKLLWGLDKRNR